MDNKEVLDTLKAARLYLNNLRSLNSEIETAVKQILNTYEETERNVLDTFSNLKQTLINILNKRENILVDRAKKIKQKGLVPLEECRNVILAKIETTNKLINLGNSIINGGLDSSGGFAKDASLLGALPEVPELKEVPFMSFNSEPSSETEVKHILTHFGSVSSIAPIQIRELIEKPGAILVEWHSVENDDRVVDIQEFRLQRAFGDVVKEKRLLVNFSDCYAGLDTQFLVKDLQPNQPYSFRVCCKFEGMQAWSPWSLPQVASTRLKPFSWRCQDDYVLSNENKIAKPIGDSPGLLTSDGPQFCVGHSIEFTLLETDFSDAFIGLVCLSENHIRNFSSEKKKSFLINRQGRIFVDETEKSTMLSEFFEGLKVSFSCDSIGGEKVRVNIDSKDRRVTYDWPVAPESKMFFVCQFSSSKWKIMIE